MTVQPLGREAICTTPEQCSSQLQPLRIGLMQLMIRGQVAIDGFQAGSRIYRSVDDDAEPIASFSHDGLTEYPTPQEMATYLRKHSPSYASPEDVQTYRSYFLLGWHAAMFGLIVETEETGDPR